MFQVFFQPIRMLYFRVALLKYSKSVYEIGSSVFKQYERHHLLIQTTTLTYWDAAIAQWIHLRLPSCHPWFESQAHPLRFYNL